MIKYENECVGCTSMGLPCIGDSCPNRAVPHYYCDKCNEEVEKLFDFENEQLCEDCIDEYKDTILIPTSEEYCERCGKELGGYGYGEERLCKDCINEDLGIDEIDYEEYTE